MPRRAAALAALLALCAGSGAHAQAMDPKNPTCPAQLNVSAYPEMRFSVKKEGGRTILIGEGGVDDLLVERLTDAIAAHQPIDELWLRSPGGNAQVGNAAGRLIRKLGIPTRIPAGWACFSACNFVFMGGPIRMIDPGGLFVVHMFTHAGDRAYVTEQVKKGEKGTLDLIGEVEQNSALLATDDNDFLIRMGVSRKLLSEVMYQQKALEEQGRDRSTRRCLSQDEVFRYNVANVR
jgi:hypothetical protein